MLPALEAPKSATEWLFVAVQRGADAAAMLEAGRNVASVYLAGYSVECALKGLMLAQGRRPPIRGREGHNIRGLWKACDLQLRDLGDRASSKAYFIYDWATDLRYVTFEIDGTVARELVTAAQETMTFLRRRARQVPSRRRQ